MIASPLRRTRARRAGWVVPALLVALASALAATPSSAADPRLGRWAGFSRDGGRVAFVVAHVNGYRGGHRIVASPSATCPKEEAATYQGFELDTFVQEWDAPNRIARQQRRATVLGGGFRLRIGFDDRALAGSLRRARGVVSVSRAFTPGGCRMGRVRVRYVGRAFSDGIYASIGTFLTRGMWSVHSGGGLVVQRSGTTWGGPPEPTISQRLGPAAGLAACTAAYDADAMAVGPTGGFGLDADFRTATNVVGTLAIKAHFVGSRSFAGTYDGDLTTSSMTTCPLRGAFTGTRVLAPAGRPLRFRAPKGRG